VQLIRCTQKLLKELKKKPVNIEPLRSLLGGWHANLFYVERRKCVLVTNDSTLYTMFIPFLKKPDFQNFSFVFGQNLFKNLLHEGFNQNQIEAVLDEHETIKYSVTNNRSVLGSMNDQKFQLEYHIHDYGGLQSTPVYEINSKLNRNILRAIELGHPIDMLIDTLKNHT